MSSVTHAVGVALAVVILVVVYFLPFLIAYWRQHRYRWLVFVINLFGASGIGWLVALVIALWTPRQRHRVGYAGPSVQSAQPLPADWRTNQQRLGSRSPGISSELPSDNDP